MEYEIVRSKRKTLALQIKPDGSVVVRAPLRVSQKEIDRFVSSHAQWVESRLQRLCAAQERVGGKLTERELDALVKRAKSYIPERVRRYAAVVGVDYGRITIRKQRTKWGSCSSKGNLNFNCLLMLAPPEVVDSVVVHELCHRKHMNHSKQFYAEVLRAFPDYHRHHKWLKESGNALMNSLP